MEGGGLDGDVEWESSGGFAVQFDRHVAGGFDPHVLKATVNDAGVLKVPGENGPGL